MTGGFIKLHRCALDSWLWKLPAEQFKVALTVLLSASWRDGVAVSGGRRVDVPRGSVASTVEELAAKSRVSVRTCRTAIKNLQELEFLTTTATNRFTVFSVVNYDGYQARDDATDKQSVNQLTNDRQTERQSTDKRPTNDRQAHYIEEEDQEGKEGEEREEEHKAPAVAGRVHAQPGLFAESAQEPRKAQEVDRGTGPDENAAPAPSGGLTKATVIAELLHGTEDERRARAQAAEHRERQGQWGRELQRRRKAIGVTAEELAKFLPFGARQVTAWEKGQGSPLPEVQGQVDAELARIDSGIRARAAAAVEEINAVSGRTFQSDSETARAAGLQAWRWGWDVERFRSVVRLICADVRGIDNGAKVRPATVFQVKRMKNAAEELAAGAVPHNGRQPLKGRPLLDEVGAMAEDMRRMGYGQRRELQ